MSLSSKLHVCTAVPVPPHSLSVCPVNYMYMYMYVQLYLCLLTLYQSVQDEQKSLKHVSMWNLVQVHPAVMS